MTGIWVVGGVLTCILVALLFVLLGLGGKPSAPTDGTATDSETLKKKETLPKDWKRAKGWAEENQVWVGLVLCHLALIIFFPEIWLFLARVPVFWLAQVFLFIAFAFLKDEKTKKLNGWGQAIVCVVVVAVVADLIGSSRKPSISASTASARHFSLPSLNPFGSSLPDENEEMKGIVVKFWQDNLPDDQVGQQRMVAVADDASHFNQFEADGKTIRREVGDRWRIGVMGIDQRLWSWAGIGSGLDISAADGNLKGALYLYKIYKGIPWTGNIWLITQRSRVVTVPASGWSERIPVGKTPLRIRPSEDMAVEDDHGKEYRVTLNEPDWNFPHYTEWVKYRSLTGKPAVVLVSP